MGIIKLKHTVRKLTGLIRTDFRTPRSEDEEIFMPSIILNKVGAYTLLKRLMVQLKLFHVFRELFHKSHKFYMTNIF